MKHPSPFEGLNSPQRARSAASPAWLMTFADLTALLVCFFVLFYAMQVIDRDRWQAMVGSLKATFSPQVALMPTTPRESYNAMPVVETRRSITYLDSLLRQRLAEVPAWRDLTGEQATDGRSFRYAIPAAFTNTESAQAQAAWVQLGVATRTWPTPREVEVSVPPGGDWLQAARLAETLAQWAMQGGEGVTAAVRAGTVSGVSWVLYASTE